MNRQIFEGRFLVNLAGGIIRQDDLRPITGGIEWEKMFRFSDYHRVANMVYLGMLGTSSKIPERWKDSFFERYVQGLTFGEKCEDAEKEILTLLDMNGVSCIVLESSNIRKLYKIPEMAYNTPLKLLINENDYTLAKGYLIDQGYETDWYYEGCGERMHHATGIYLEIYHTPPFRTRLYKKNMENLFKYAYVTTPYNHVRQLSPNEQFVFLMAQCIYRYVLDELRIREILDLYLYYHAWKEELEPEYIEKTLESFQIEDLAEKFLILSYMWFGTLDDLEAERKPESMEPYDVLENRLLSRTPQPGKETNEQALALRNLIDKEIDKERRQERREHRKKQRKERWDAIMRKVHWVLPEYKFMCSMYPILKYLPPLLPIFWLLRLIRFGIRMLFSK